jgi:hypothetical protein
LVLDLLWKNVEKRQLTHDCYDAIGGKDGMKTVLVKLADDVYDGFVKQGKVKEFKQVFLRLVAIGNANTPHTRRIDTRADIGEDNWREIVLKLVEKRLLKTDLDEQGKEIVEVIHETLIQSWQQLGNWIEQHRHDLERIAEIELAAIKWNRNQRSKHYLLHGKELKDARKFWKNREDLFVNFSKKSNIFINASSEKQLFDRSVLILVQTLMISPWILIGYTSFILFTHPKTSPYPTEQPTIKISY